MDMKIACRTVCMVLVLFCCVTTNRSEERKNLHESNQLIRQKRNILCYFGVNKLLKGVLYDSLEDLQKDDPVMLGNSTNNRLYDGVLQGLSTLDIVSELNVDCDDYGLVFSTTLGLMDAVVHFKWKRLGLDGTIWSRAEVVNFDLEVKLNMTSKVRFDVTKLLITKLEGFRFGFSGLGPLNPLVRSFVKTMNKVWSTKVSKIIQKLLKKALEKQLSKLTLPF